MINTQGFHDVDRVEVECENGDITIRIVQPDYGDDVVTTILVRPLRGEAFDCRNQTLKAKEVSK